MKLKIFILILVTTALAIFFGIKINKTYQIILPSINQNTFTEGDVTTPDGATLHWWKFDRKTSLTTYVLHGGPDGQSKWMLESGNELADILGTVVFYDRRGCGASSRNVLEDSMTYNVAATDLKLVIDQTSLPESPFIFLGHSFGSVLATHFAPLFKDRLKAIILSSPFLGIKSEMQGREAWAKSFVDQQCPNGYLEVPNECAAAVGTGWGISEYYFQTNYLSDLAAINVPILLINGSCDGLANASVVAAAKKALPNIQTITVPGGNHRVLFYNTNLVSDALKNFIKSITS